LWDRNVDGIFDLNNAISSKLHCVLCQEQSKTGEKKIKRNGGRKYIEIPSPQRDIHLKSGFEKSVDKTEN